MTNFDFLKGFNKELYEIGIKLEEDVLESPRAVTADATLFLENIVKDIYRLSNNKLDKNLISFYKKIDNLYRQGVISYFYKNKLQDAYTLRNRIHQKNLGKKQEEKLAFDLHKRLYYISKKYFRDFCDNARYINIPDYQKPTKVEFHFDNCIICGSPNKTSQSNMCKVCNQKIDNANFMLSLEESFLDMKFTRQDLIDFGIEESRAILLLMDLSKYGAVVNKGRYYKFDRDNFQEYLSEIDEYIKIGIMINKFYKDEISAYDIKNTHEYQKGSKNEKFYRELFKLVNQKVEKTFEANLIKLNDIEKSMKISSMSQYNINHWYSHQKELFNQGSLNEAFILYNEILINDFFKMQMKGMDENEIMKELNIYSDTLYFWKNHFIEGDFYKKNKNTKQKMIINEIKNNKSLNDSLESAKVTKNDFDKMYLDSKMSNDEFSKKIDEEYVAKRQKLLIKHLKSNNLNKAIKLTKISKKEFLNWYYKGERESSEFYIKTTELLMEKYISYRKNDWNKKEILKEINVSSAMFNTWSQHDEFKLFRDFEEENNKITSSLLKRGKIINSIKDGKGKEEAIFSANITPREFMEIYNNSKKEGTDFYLRFDVEYEKSRKKQFMKLIHDDDFYCVIQKCEISQKEFNKWYIKDQDKFISSGEASPFYLTTTDALMNKYLKARLNGKNQPDAAKSVGLSNSIINKWLNHTEHSLYSQFEDRYNQVMVDLIVDGFKKNKSKMEVSEISDISIKTVDEFIEQGKSENSQFEELSNLYEGTVIPVHLDIFLQNFKNKSFNRSIKNSKLTAEELNYYYELGKSGNERFADFYRDYLNVKMDIYVNNMISRKSKKIALRNSHLSKDELDSNIEEIENNILKKRISIISDGIIKNKRTGVKLAKSAGISVDEIYKWYLEGKNGNEKYKALSMLFECGVIAYRLFEFNEAISIGIPKSYVKKQLKKDIGNVDYKFWVKYDIFNQKLDYFDFENYCLDEEKIKNVLKEADFLNITFHDGIFKALNSNRNLINDKTKFPIKVSIIDASQLSK